MLLPDDSAQQDTSLLAFHRSACRLFKVRLQHRVPSRGDRQLACRYGVANLHIGLGEFFKTLILIARIKKN